MERGPSIHQPGTGGTNGAPGPAPAPVAGQLGPAGCRPSSVTLRDAILDAAERVVARQGIANLTLDAVAAEAGLSKGGLLHHYHSKDKLVEGLVEKTAAGWRACCMGAYERTAPGPGRMARALLTHIDDAQAWNEQCRRSSSAVFAALAQNPSLIAPMRAVYADIRRLIDEDGLPPGVGETVAAAIDGLWLYWVLNLVTVDQELIGRVRRALRMLLADAAPGGAGAVKGTIARAVRSTPARAARPVRGRKGGSRGRGGTR